MLYHSFLLFLTFLSSILSLSKAHPINVWPKPTKTIWPNPTAIPLSPTFKIHSPHPRRHHPHLAAAVDRYSLLIASERHRPIVPPSVNITLSGSLTSLTILVSDLSRPLQHGVDESYTISITSALASLTAATAWGAMRGLETFSQLAWGDPPVVAAEIYIDDRPKFPHRGILLDTSRNFYPKRDLLRTIDAMAGNKLNVFHWHITDSQSFPIELPTVPELAEKGAYGAEMRYAVKDVAEIVEYGLSRGVRVMPEIDAPG